MILALMYVCVGNMCVCIYVCSQVTSIKPFRPTLHVLLGVDPEVRQMIYVFVP
jgi:hypothetical protein